MSANNENRQTDNVLQKNINIPVHTTDLSTFDDAFSSMKERFQAEMRRMDEEMRRFSSNLMCLYGQTLPGITMTSSSEHLTPQTANWDSITNSPLVTGEGQSKTLKLQFDVSTFSPDEVTVKIIDNVLKVTAIHDEKNDNSTSHYEYHRECLLPKGIDKEAVVSSLSRDGVLTIQTPLPQLIDNTSKPKRYESVNGPTQLERHK